MIKKKKYRKLEDLSEEEREEHIKNKLESNIDRLKLIVRKVRMKRSLINNREYNEVTSRIISYFDEAGTYDIDVTKQRKEYSMIVESFEEQFSKYLKKEIVKGRENGTLKGTEEMPAVDFKLPYVRLNDPAAFR